jgi:hypothetical protein
MIKAIIFDIDQSSENQFRRIDWAVLQYAL